MNDIHRSSWNQKFRLFGILPSILALIIAFNSCGGNSSSSSSGGMPPDACPVGPVNMSSGSLSIGNCTISGNVTLSGNASIIAMAGTVSIAGNLIESDSAAFTVENATLEFPQQNTDTYQIQMSGSSNLVFNNATLVTNGTSNNNFTVVLNASGSSKISISNSTLDNTRSWLLGNLADSSTLTVNSSTFLPTETYPTDSTQVTFTNSNAGTIWLQFVPSSSANVTLPVVDGNGDFNFNFGSNGGTNIDYQVTMTGSKAILGFNSMPDSTINLTGAEALIQM